MRRTFVFFAMFALSANVTFAASPIYISQIQITGGKNNTDQDFIELFNPNPLAVNLKGYRLVKRSQAGSGDVLIKFWSKDAFVPAKSFYLWANSGYTSIFAKPDVATSATLADDNGVALRFGNNDTGTIIDSLAWGKASNGFKNVSALNPGAGQSLVRKDLYTAVSPYVIALSAPHNSSANDLTAAFSTSELASQPGPAQAAKAPASAKTQIISQGPLVEAAATLAPAPNTASPTAAALAPITSELQPQKAFGSGVNPPLPQNSLAKNYLILAGLALLALIVIVKKFFFKKAK